MWKILVVLQVFVFRCMANTTFIQQMTLVRGTLLPFDNCTFTTTMSFINCTLMCAKTPSCNMNQLQNKTCLLCGSNSGRLLANDSRGDLLGIKVSGWANFSQMCLSIRYNYTAPKSTETTPKTCPHGWGGFQRGNVSWCIKVVIPSGNNSRNNYTAALDTCRNLNSTLSGLNSVREQVFVRDSAYQLLGKTMNNTTGNPRIWVDGTRRPQCSSANWTSIPSCSGTNAFRFSDPTLVTPAGYLWYTNEPNGDLNDGVIQGCINMIITKDKTNKAYGKMDDIGCNYGSPILIVLCGQLAT